MTARPRVSGVFWAAAALLAAKPAPAVACAACFGRSDSPLAAGMNMGILSLLIVVMAVLASIAGFFVFVLHRAARGAAVAAAAGSLAGEPAQRRKSPGDPA